MDFFKDFVLSEVEMENRQLKEKVQKLSYELETQKGLTTHYEGIANIMSAEMKKTRWIEGLSRSERVHALLSEFNSEMRGFLSDKQQILQRFGRIENIYHSIVAILKNN